MVLNEEGVDVCVPRAQDLLGSYAAANKGHVVAGQLNKGVLKGVKGVLGCMDVGAAGQHWSEKMCRYSTSKAIRYLLVLLVGPRGLSNSYASKPTKAIYCTDNTGRGEMGALFTYLQISKPRTMSTKPLLINTR